MTVKRRFEDIDGSETIELSTGEIKKITAEMKIAAQEAFDSGSTFTDVPLAATTATRPNYNNLTGKNLFDLTLNKPVYWNGSVWVDATGTPAGYDADFVAYSNSVVGVSANLLYPFDLNNMISGLKTDGVWTKITDMSVLAGVSTVTGALLPIKTSTGISSLNVANIDSTNYIPSGPDACLHDYNNIKYGTTGGDLSMGSANIGTITLASACAIGYFGQTGGVGPQYIQTANGEFQIWQDTANIKAKMYGSSFSAPNYLAIPARVNGGDIIAVRSATTLSLQVNDAAVQTSSAGGAPTAPTASLLQIITAGGVGTSCAAYFVAPNASVAEAQLIRNRIRTYLAAIGRVNNIKGFIYEGDSNTAGFGVNGYHTYLKTKTGWEGRHLDVALSSQEASLAVTTYASQINPFRADGTHITKSLAFFMIGTNDLRASATSATVLGNLRTLWSNSKVTDGNKTIACTIMPRNDAGWTGTMETQRLALNASIIADSANYDALLRPDLWFPNTADTTYWQADQLHLNEAGQSRFADMVAAQINPATI